MDAKKPLTDCHFYSIGKCIKGDKCEFRHVHSPETFEQTKICKFWRQETCDNIACPYRHPTLPRAPDGSLIMCVYEMHGGCTKGDACPYAHKYSGSKASIPGLEDPPSRLNITLAAPSTEPRFISRPSATETSSGAEGEETQTVPPEQLKEEVPTEPVSKRLKRQLVGELAASRKTESIIGLGRSEPKNEPKPQGVSFVKSFQDILKEKEKEKEAKGAQDASEKGKEKEPQAPPKAAAPPQKEAKTAEESAVGRKRKFAAGPAGGSAEPKRTPPEKAAEAGKPQARPAARLSKPAPGAAPAADTAPAKPSFGIKTLDELLKEKQNQADSPQAPQQPAKLATSADARATSNPRVRAEASKPAPAAAGGSKRKAEALKDGAGQHSAAATTAASPTAAKKPRPADGEREKGEEESIDDLEKELEELGVELGADDGTTGDEEAEVDVELDLGI